MKSFLIRELKIKKIWVVGLIVLMVGVWNNLNFAESGSTSSSSLKMLWNIISPGKSVYKPGSEPDGFRGIKWGTKISTLKGMEYVRTDPSSGGIKVYIRKGDDLHIGSAKLERIEYGFWKGKFFDVYIITKGSTNFSGLADAVFEKFGMGFQPNKSEVSFMWIGDITQMTLEYNEVTKKGILHMYSEKISAQQEAYAKQKAKQKAKEGAEKGF